MSKLKHLPPGVYNDLDIDAYHSDPAIGSSGIKAFLESPRLYQYQYLTADAERAQPSRSMIKGSATHTILFEPHLFQDLFDIAQPEMEDRRAKGWKALNDEAAFQGKTLLLYKEYQGLKAMRDQLHQHEIIRNMLGFEGHAEQSHFILDGETTLMVKARPDRLMLNQGVIIDYKTTKTSLDIRAFADHSFRMGRHIQAAHHRAVVQDSLNIEIKSIIHIAQMQEPPYLCRVFVLQEDWLRIGDAERKKALAQIAECQAKQDYPSFMDGHIVVDLPVPAWAEKHTLH